MTATDAIRALLNRATRAERPVVEALALAAGLLWKCLAYGCGTINEDDDAFCSRCRQARKRS